MQANRPQGTRLEKLVMRALTSAGFRYSRHVSSLPGKPDVVFREQCVVVFVDGDFWHGFRYPVWRYTLPAYWQAKIERNRRRDRRNIRSLRRSGWRVLRVWEHQAYDDVDAVVRRIGMLIRKKPNKGRR